MPAREHAECDGNHSSPQEQSPDSAPRRHPNAPQLSELPSKKFRAGRTGPELCTINVKLKVVTPILGGAAVAGTIDDVDVIRVPTVRGHLRFWWRALFGHDYRSDASLLFDAESELWGRASRADNGGDDEQQQGRGRSMVDVRVTIDERNDAYDRSNPLEAPGAYALWPARVPSGGQDGHLPRRRPDGAAFTLTLSAPKNREAELRNVLGAWILFGGYGSRTRRGLGSLTVVDNAKDWLPAAPTREAFTTLFGRDVFAGVGEPVCETPWLAGAALHRGPSSMSAVKAWTTALDWLKEFRQGIGSRGADPGARRSGEGKAQPNRPSVSNWPEAEMVRRIGIADGRGPYDHGPSPEYGPGRAWPRAAFGLPIVGQFQRKGRAGRRYSEPGNFELRWHDGTDERNRLASPLILKALPVADGRFVPCALWLHRAYPIGQVVLRDSSPASTGAEFDARYSVPSGVPEFIRDAGTGPLRDAFLSWLKRQPGTNVVAP